MKSLLAAALLVSGLSLAAPAFAMSNAEPVRVAGLNSSDFSHYLPRRVTRAGQTKPPGHAFDRRGGTTDALDRKSAAISRYIQTAVCTAC